MPHEKTIQLFRTAVPNSPPTGLVEGELAIEMASQPPKLWCGVPNAISANGRLRLNTTSVASGTAPTGPVTGDLWYNTDTNELTIWNGTQWDALADDLVLPLTIPDGGTGATNAGAALLNLGALPSNNPSFTGTMNGPTLTVGLAPNQLVIDSTGHLRVANGRPLTLGGDATAVLDAVPLQQLNAAIAGIGGGAHIGATPPTNPQVGDLWWRSDPDGEMFIWYDDGTTAQWVVTKPNGAAGPPGIQGPPGAAGGTFPDAASDGVTYGRRNAAWNALEGPWENFNQYVVGGGTVWNIANSALRIRLINGGSNVQIEGGINAIAPLAFPTATVLAQLPARYQPGTEHNSIIYAISQGTASLAHLVINATGEMLVGAEFSSVAYVAISIMYGV